MATPDGFSSLPYDSVKLAVAGGRKRGSARSGAVRVDLSWADKSIRRPGSAPDLAAGEEVLPSRGSPATKKAGSFKERTRSSSSDSREAAATQKKAGVSPGTRKVAFAGIEEDSSSSESDKRSEGESGSSDGEEEVWVKQPEAVQTSGIVIAQHQACPGHTAAKLQTNKCNGIR